MYIFIGVYIARGAHYFQYTRILGGLLRRAAAAVPHRTITFDIMKTEKFVGGLPAELARVHRRYTL